MIKQRLPIAFITSYIPYLPRFAKQKLIILIAIICLSCGSGIAEERSSSGKNDPLVFLQSASAQTASHTKNKKGTARITPASQFKVLGVQVEKENKPTPTAVPTGNNTQKHWGVAKQIDEHTWTIDVGEDERVGTPQEILDALNAYRRKHGRGPLTWDTKLAEYAKTRTDYFQSIQTLDSHKGFMDYVNNQDGFHKLGFGGLGENSSIGYKLEGVHLIEWVYASDEGHNTNQLNSQWTHVGIGVTETATNLIFGGNKF